MVGQSRMVAIGLVALALPAPSWADDGPHAIKPAPRVEVVPYIEADQVVSAELNPTSDTVTYSTVAAGVDATATGHYSAGSVSVRYERHFAEGSGGTDGDTISGVARASFAVVPHAVTIEAGALASQDRVDSSGGVYSGAFADTRSAASRIYSGYIGPSVETQAGDLQVEAHYRFGYTKVQEPTSLVVGTTSAVPIDLADSSTTHNAQARIGFRPYTLLPIGAGVGGSWIEQDVSNLDQRVRDRNVRGDVTVPVSPTLALVGGVGYEDVEVSSRDAVRDSAGNPVIGPDGRYVTDHSAPRKIAYQTDGIIWDAGVMWRPSTRTSLEAHVGRRYDSMTYYGSFAYKPNTHESINVSVYDGVTSFGGLITDQLAGLPSQFSAVRNILTGSSGGCVASLEGGACINGALGSLESAAFRGRGVSATYSVDLGHTTAGIGVGYDRRKFIVAPGTVIASANGVVDETWWASAYASTKLDARSSIDASATAHWFDSGFASGGHTLGYSASLAYYRRIVSGLTGTAAVGVDSISEDKLPDVTSASALLGLRYSF